eukprot:TRINITY_DN8939_c0_g1_i1.p2 TRINITY_DN8939_c0_g1~~TRINITY_DN8939_c0_g1_i1.p2  ORF type:complete len:124 (+),score=14.76 TRINITY_DN8939_c0_g1_i1:258-629(+)
MLVYMAVVRPFKKKYDNFINIFNEAAIVFTFISVIAMNNYTFSVPVIKVWGWILIAPVIFSLIVTWIIVLPGTFKELKESIKKLFSKKGDAEKIELKTSKETANNSKEITSAGHPNSLKNAAS